MLGGYACGRFPTIVSEPQPVSDRWEHLQRVQTLIDNRDFEGAVREYQDVLSRPTEDQCADLALFDLGLLYAHYANPKKDYGKSLVFFTRMIKEHPRSPLVEEAKIWVNLLETMEKTKWVDIELEEKKKVLKK
jgi:outer membrane protein assembly factor BamD (BamD/ComL family)